LGGWLGCGAGADALRIKDEGLRFGFGALGWELFAVPQEADTGRIADPDDKLALRAERSGGRRDQSFLGDELSVGGDRDPGVFAGTDDQGESSSRLLGGCRDGGAKGTDGHVVLLFDLDRIRLLAGFRRRDRNWRAMDSRRSWHRLR